MDLFSGLGTYWAGLLASTLLLLQLFSAQASIYLNTLASSVDQYLVEFTITHTSPIPQTSVGSTATDVSTSTPVVTAATSTATTTKKVAAKKPVVAKTTTATTSVPKQPLAPIIPPEQVNTLARASIVNILCISQSGGSVRSISGSGVIIDARGVILTNAHIGQYFLLRDYPTKNAVDCVVRTGSPATPLYRATLLYLPPAWINENASQIKAAQGTGTGENDYALLKISETTNPQGILPASYTNIAMTASTPDTGDQALVAGYPAGFLDGLTIERNLYATSAFTTIGTLYTFNDPTHVDVVSLGGTVVSQGGSSGGAVLRTYDGKLVGLISTATAGTTTSDRDLRAITIGYIDRSLREAGKGGIAEILSQDLSTLAADFAATTFIEEKKKLIDALSN